MTRRSWKSDHTKDRSFFDIFNCISWFGALNSGLTAAWREFSSKKKKLCTCILWSLWCSFFSFSKQSAPNDAEKQRVAANAKRTHEKSEPADVAAATESPMKKIKTGDILSLRDELDAQLAKDRSEPPEVRPTSKQLWSARDSDSWRGSRVFMFWRVISDRCKRTTSCRFWKEGYRILAQNRSRCRLRCKQKLKQMHRYAQIHKLYMKLSKICESCLLSVIIFHSSEMLLFL